MSRWAGTTSWRRIAAALRLGAVAVAVGLLVLAMLGAVAIAILAVIVVVGTMLGR